MYTTGRPSFENNVGLALVQSDTNSVQFVLEESLLFVRLGSIQHDENEIGRLGS